MKNKTEEINFIANIGLEEMHKEIVREIVVRRRVYPDWIASGRIDLLAAEYRIAVLETVALKLSDLMQKEKPQGSLFDDSEVF